MRALCLVLLLASSCAGASQETRPSHRAHRHRARAHLTLRQAIAVAFRHTGHRHYVVDRAALHVITSHEHELAQSAQFVPDCGMAGCNGFRVSGIKPLSVWKAMGLRNGDVIERIDGIALDTPDKAKAAIHSAEKRRVVRIDVARGGRTIRMTYTLE